MVFEHLFPKPVLENQQWSAFFLAIIYSTVSILMARLLFPANSGIVSVIFLSIFLIPYFEDVLAREELRERRAKDRTFKRLFLDNLGGIKTYFFLFFGIYLTYMLYAFTAPHLGFDIGSVFREQLSLEVVRGGAVFEFGTFIDIFLNNWWVLLACFLIALIAGDGAIFFIAWNASTWGTIFGYRAFAAGANTGESAILMLLIIVVITLPHLLLEGGAYILAALAGGVISDQFDKVDEVRKFVLYFICALLVYVIAYIVFRMLFGPGILLGFVAMLSALGLLWLLQFALEDDWDAWVFRYNFYLFLTAICIFIIGAFVETFVLYNAAPLQRVYWAAMGF